MTTPMRRLFARALVGITIAALAWSLAIGAAGGFRFTAAGIQISATNASRPLMVALAAAAAAMLLRGFQASHQGVTQFVRTRPRTIALAMAAGTLIVGLSGNSWTASGADSFAYVSQASLWRQGRLDIPVPLAANAPWPNAAATFAPFGYRPAPDGARIVPITAPAVPIAMAVLQRIGGHAGAFLVTPVAGALLVLLTYAIGSRVDSPMTGLAAAWLVATSPAVLYMLMWPMSDLPAAVCAAAMICLLLGRSSTTSIAAGAVASIGLLTRPNFVVIAAAAGLWLFTLSWRRVGLFAAGLAPGAIALAVLNLRWFGSAVASGYGSAGHLLNLAHVPANAFLFAKWLTETSPVAWVGIFATLLAMRQRRDHLRPALLFAMTLAAAVSVYLFYDVHAEWWYLRFLLPAWPSLFVPAAMVLLRICERGRAAAAAVGLLIVAAGIAGAAIASARGVFSLGEGERRYVSVARFVSDATERDAVILTSQHAGTVWYYAGRQTIRYDVLDPGWLDRTIAWLSARGRHPYILVEDWEHPLFEARFKASDRAGDLSYPPLVAWQSTRILGWTWLYDPLDRTRPTRQPGPQIELNQPRCAPPAEVFSSDGTASFASGSRDVPAALRDGRASASGDAESSRRRADHH